MKRTLPRVLNTLFTCFLLTAYVGNSQSKTAEPSSTLPITSEVKIGKLSNGLTYYIQNNGKPEDKVELRLKTNWVLRILWST